MELVELHGDYRLGLAPGILSNRAATQRWMQICEDKCWVCQQCYHALEMMYRILGMENTRAFIIKSDRDFIVAGMYFIGNEFHGNSFDGRLVGKTTKVKEALDEIKKEYGVVRSIVPKTAESIIRWEKERLGFEEVGILPGAWDGEVDVVEMEYR